MNRNATPILLLALLCAIAPLRQTAAQTATPTSPSSDPTRAGAADAPPGQNEAATAKADDPDSPSPLAASIGEELWLLVPRDDGAFFLYVDPPRAPGIQRAKHLRGRVLPTGMAAGRDRLWLVYQRHSVQSVHAQHFIPTGRYLFRERFEQALPQPVELITMAVTKGGPWAVLRADTDAGRDALKRLADPVLHDPDAMRPAEATATAGVERDAEPPGSLEAPPVVDQLVTLVHNRWTPCSLPGDWPTGAQAWVLPRGKDASSPVLIAASRLATGVRLLVYREVTPAPSAAGDSPAGDANDASDRDSVSRPRPPAPSRYPWPIQGGQLNIQWQKQVYELDGQGELAPIVLNQQIVVGQVTEQADDTLSIAVSVLRPERISELGSLSVTGSNVDAWAFVPHGGAATLITRDADRSWVWSKIDLKGNTRVENQPIETAPSEIPTQTANLFMLAATLVLAMMMMMMFWRRDVEASRLDLPEGVELADLGRRATSAVLDLIPSLMLTALAFRIDPFTFSFANLQSQLPEMHPVQVILVPCLFAALAFAIHTGVCELLSGTSIGKLAMGIRVADLKGNPPLPWQFLLRNAFKWFEMVAFPLIMIPWLVPTRQRLGDMVAQTIVVSAIPGEVENDDDDGF